jgi:hypothetical protein
MMFRTQSLAIMFFFLIGAGSVEGQHCGGPCEVPRGVDPVSTNPRYTLSEGIEVANWRYLFNWFWTVNGEQQFRVESSLASLPARDFGFRRMFVSPSGNGFLVTGNPFAGQYLKGKEPPLFVFFDPEGKQLSVVSLFQAVEANGRKLGQCPNCDCADVLYVFAQDPTLSDNGVFVELRPYRSNPISFFLPFGCLVRDRRSFEDALEAAEWSRLSGEEAEQEKEAIQFLIGALNSDDVKVRSEASEAILAKGFLARTAINRAKFASLSGNIRARAKVVETNLRPLGGSTKESMSTDLGLLSSMLSYSEPEVVQSLRLQLQRILPQLEGLAPEEYVAWIAEHRKSLKWNAAIGQYE